MYKVCSSSEHGGGWGEKAIIKYLGIMRGCLAETSINMQNNKTVLEAMAELSPLEHFARQSLTLQRAYNPPTLSSQEHQHWRELLGVNVEHWYQTVWETALLEKLTNKPKLAQGQINKDAFTPVWFPFITHTAQQEPSDSMQIDMANLSQQPFTHKQNLL
ncbi:Hypothetical predicted protein [Podarcis lilfordi]|uniref:Uncharacterized protein n=1 Tax=Podarcis lilfordi TaxID=74358 RepID=A0AA35P447_9SAUR|nr:Hypothetical predicted protein [Podarcis lilfordi]